MKDQMLSSIGGTPPPSTSLTDGVRTDEESDDFASSINSPAIAATIAPSIAKGLSPAVGNKRKRTAQLVGRLKRSRNYAKPVRGGTRRKRRL